MLSTLHRRRAAYDFSQCYEDLCCSHGACPLAMVTQRTSKSSLVCSGERVRPTDWIPLCRAMQMNKSLESVKLMFDPSREQLGKSRRGMFLVTWHDRVLLQTHLFLIKARIFKFQDTSGVGHGGSTANLDSSCIAAAWDASYPWSPCLRVAHRKSVRLIACPCACGGLVTL